MRWAEGFIAVDWGTTNRRAWLIEGGGQVADEMEDGRGVLSVASGEFPAAVSEIRDRLGDRPLLLAGMAGSTRGWMDAPYVRCPLGLEQLAARLVWAEPGQAAIVPGASIVEGERADIMRGEEVQILGAAAAGTIPADCTVCHPGTHNKWIEVRGGRLERFATVMTGELFGLLKKHSILSEHLQQQVSVGDAFRAGVRRGLSGSVLSAELFSIRAKSLLGKLAAGDAAPYASGLLIGADVASALGTISPGQVIVMGSPKLTALYSAALAEAGREPLEVDGEQAFLAGARKIAELID
jgi:2-dehydro-3-deoxygalactonokinase